MAGKVPVEDESSTTVPSLVVAATTVVMAAWFPDGVVNAAKLKAIAPAAEKSPPALLINTTFKIFAGVPVMEGVHV